MNELVNVFQIDLALSTASLALLVYLLVVYVRLYREMKQRFTLGLILFTLILIVKTLPVIGRDFAIERGPREFHTNATANFPRDTELGGDLLYLRLIPAALELVAVAVLVWLTRE